MTNADNSVTHNRDWLWGLVLPLAIFLAQAIWLFNFSIDDGSISYRFARHLAEGRGLRWNLTGLPVEGYSNFLWVLVLAGGHWLGFDIDLFASGLGAVLGAVNLVLLFMLCRRLWPGNRMNWLPVLYVALTPTWAMWALSGLELAMFGFFLLLAVYSLTIPSLWRTRLLSLAVVGLTLTRPEGAVLALVPLFCGWFADRKTPLNNRLRRYGFPLIILILTIAAMTLFRLLYFGYPVANTVYAKFSTALPALGEVSKWLFFGLPAFAAWIVGAWWRGSSPYRGALAAAIVLVLTQVILVLPVNPVMYFLHRYLIAFLPLLLLPLPLVLAKLAEKRRILAITVAVLLAGWMVQDLPAVNERFITEKSFYDRHRCVAETLNSIPVVTDLALIDVGRIPYWTDLYTYDVWGLCDRDIAHQGFSYEKTIGREPGVYVMTVKLRNGKLYPYIGYDVMISEHPTFQREYVLWRICRGKPGLRKYGYDYAIYLNTEWAARNGLTVEPIDRANP